MSCFFIIFLHSLDNAGMVSALEKYYLLYFYTYLTDLVLMRFAMLL